MYVCFVRYLWDADLQASRGVDTVDSAGATGGGKHVGLAAAGAGLATATATATATARAASVGGGRLTLVPGPTDVDNRSSYSSCGSTCRVVRRRSFAPRL